MNGFSWLDTVGEVSELLADAVSPSDLVEQFATLLHRERNMVMRLASYAGHRYPIMQSPAAYPGCPALHLEGPCDCGLSAIVAERPAAFRFSLRNA